MAPTKETLLANTTDTAVSQTNARGKRDSVHMRSDAVSLEVPVKVHGSRVDEAALGANPKSEPFEEQTSTMIVFPQGGVLKMATPVTAGQMMVLTNLKSGHDSICRVVKVRAYGAGQSYVEVEFTHRQPGYWGVYFPSDGPETTDQLTAIPPAAPAATPASMEPRVEKRPSPDVSSHASVAKPPVAKSAGPADSVFAPIGSQEQVQPAASATSSRVKPSSIAEHASKYPDFETAVSPVVDSLPVAPSSPVASVSLGELQGDAEAAPALSFAGAGVPGEVAEDPLPDSAPLAEQPAPLGHFATALGASESTQSKGKHGAAIALSAAALIAVAAGAAYYFQWFPFGTKSAAKPAATIPAPAEVPLTAATPQTNLVPQGLNPAPPPTPANSATIPSASSAAVTSAPKVNATAPAPLRSSKSASEAPPAAAPVTSNPPSKVPDMFVALNAHPTSRAYSADSGSAETAAPAVDSDGSDGGLSAIASSSVVPPPSEEQQAPVRIRVGGEIKPPRLVSSVLPVYPVVARETGIEGDVVIDTTIDKTGKVTGMKVVSGNAMLRQAALDALRQWKYEPSKLNGEAVPVQLTVTIKFHRQ